MQSEWIQNMKKNRVPHLENYKRDCFYLTPEQLNYFSRYEIADYILYLCPCKKCQKEYKTKYGTP